MVTDQDAQARAVSDAQSRRDVAALLTLGDDARRQGQHRLAFDLLSQAVTLAPMLVPARCALANLLLHTGQPDIAAEHLSVAMQYGSDKAYVWRDLGLLRRVTGDPAGALDAFDRCLALTPDDRDVALSRSLCLLRLGRWRDGFADYHHRWSVAVRPPRHQQIAPWQGENPGGKRILVWDEQGAGDTIMCVRLLRMLMDAGTQVVLEVPSVLRPLFDDGRHGTVATRGENLPPVDAQVALMDLPGLLGILPTTIPWNGPYIAAPVELAAQWGARLARNGSRPRIGISWAGNPAHPGDFWRSPGLAALLPLMQSGGIDWFVLQVASGRAEMQTQPLPATVTDLGDLIRGWQDTVAILPHLDLLITPDSALAHLAGAMGRPVWTLIATDTDWRWLESGVKTGWYPSMRLFRQKHCGDWAGVVARVAAALPA